MQACPGHLAGQGGDRFAGLRLHHPALAIHPAALQSPDAEGEARQAPVRDQQVGARADHPQGQIALPSPTGQGNQLVAIGGLGEPLGRSPHPPGGELLEWHSRPQARRGIGAHLRPPAEPWPQ